MLCLGELNLEWLSFDIGRIIIIIVIVIVIHWGWHDDDDDDDDDNDDDNDDDDHDDDDDGDDGEREMHFCDAAIAGVKSGRLICTKVVSLPVGASDGDDDNSSMMVTVRTMRMKRTKMGPS